MNGEGTNATPASAGETRRAEATRKAEGYLRALLGKKAPETFNEGALRCAALVAAWVGLHNVKESALAGIDWTRPYVELRLNPGQSLDSYDADDMTRLVFLAHDYAVRAEVSGHRSGCLVLRLHPRSRTGSGWARHPTLAAAVDRWRAHHPEVEVPT